MDTKEKQIDYRKCNYLYKTRICNGMIWCNKLKAYRALGLRYCKLAWS